MDITNSISLLASFATIKSLSDAKKYHNSYQILAEFIRYIIVTDSLHSFQANEMKNKLNERFGFSIPESVVKTASKRIDNINLVNGNYTVQKTEIDAVFEEKKNEADSINDNIINLLTEYVRSRSDNFNVEKEDLTKALIKFLVEDQHTSGNYIELISEFILINEQNEKIQEGLNRIREGSILYLGINHNIAETGSITKSLTLYLGTEILFSLAGYNGEIYKQLADDFYNIVRSANLSRKK